MATIFTDIINKRVPAYILAEDSNYISFLDIRPKTLGHSLVVPKLEIDNIFDLPDEYLAGMHIFAKKIANALKTATQKKRIIMMVEGFEIPHAHIHLIPSDSPECLKTPSINITKFEFDSILTEIKKYIKL